MLTRHSVFANADPHRPRCVTEQRWAVCVCVCVCVQMALFKCPPPAERTNSFLWMIHLDFFFFFFCSSFHNVMQPGSSYITSLQLHQRTDTTFLHNQISDLTNTLSVHGKKDYRCLVSRCWCQDDDSTPPHALYLRLRAYRWIQGWRELQLSLQACRNIS